MKAAQLTLAVALFSLLVKTYAVPDTLVVGSFGGGGRVDRLARQLGWYTQKNLNVTFVSVTSSDFQFDQLANGAFDIISTNGDNLVYRWLNLGREEFTLVAENSGSNGLWFLGNRNLGIETVQDVEGKIITVDSPMSGFITTGRKVLQAAGVPLRENLLVSTGNQFQRLNDLIAGNANATVNSGIGSFVAVAKNPQLVKLGDMRDFVCPYFSGAIIVLKSWLANPANYDKLVRYLRIQLQGWKWQIDPAHKQEIVEEIRVQNQISVAFATQLYDISITSPDQGLNAYLVPRRRGITKAIEVRVEDLRISRAPCLPAIAELVSRPGGWVNLAPLMQAAGQELFYWNVLGQYYLDAPVPCAPNPPSAP